MGIHSPLTHFIVSVCLFWFPGFFREDSQTEIWAISEQHILYGCVCRTNCTYPEKMGSTGWHLCCLRGPGAHGATCPVLTDPRGSASNAAAGAFLDRYVVTLFERLHSFLQDIWVHWRHNWERVWSHSCWCKQRAAPPESVWLRGWYIEMKHNTKIFFSLGCLP